MKKTLLTILALLLCIPLLFSCAEQAPETSAPQTSTKETASQTTVKQTEQKETAPLSTAKQTAPQTETKEDPVKKPAMSEDGKHIYGYEDLVSFGNFLTVEQWNEFIIFDKTLGRCVYGHLIDYYGITKEEFIADHQASGEKSSLAKYYDAWFSEDYANHPDLVHPDYVPSRTESVTLRPEGVTSHTQHYFTIDTRLIEYVGLRAFKAYKEKFAGTMNFNIVHFVDYFDIDKEEYLTIYPELFKPYNADYLYGDKEMQELYFCRHDIHEK